MRPGRWLRRGVTLLSLGAAGTAVVVTTRHLLETPQPLESTLPGEGQVDRKHGGNMYYNVAGPRDAEPLVLLHDFYPGASNYEYRHIFPRFATNYRVYAPDWLGFGLSEHPNIAYTGEFYAAVLTGFLKDVVQRPAIVLGTGHAANVAVRAASDTPDLFTRVILVSPDAMAGLDLEPSVPQVLARAAQRVSLGVVPYAFLSTRPVLRRQRDTRAVRLEGNLTQDEALDHLYASAHQFGAHHALMALMTGAIDLPIQNALALLTPPALIISGEDDPQHPREEMEDLAVLSPHTDLEILPGAGAAVAEDQPALFVDAVARWLHGLGAASERPVELTVESLTVETMILPGTEETSAPEDMGDFSHSSDPALESTSGVVAEPTDEQASATSATLPVTPAAPQPEAAEAQAEDLRTMPAPTSPELDPVTYETSLADSPLVSEMTAPSAAAAEAGPVGQTSLPNASAQANTSAPSATTSAPSASTSAQSNTGTDMVAESAPLASAPTTEPAEDTASTSGTPTAGIGQASAQTQPATRGEADVMARSLRQTSAPTSTSPTASRAKTNTARPSTTSASAANMMAPQSVASTETPPSTVPVRTPENAQPTANGAAAEEKPTFAERRESSSRQTQPRPRSRTNSRPRAASSSGESSGSRNTKSASGSQNTKGASGTHRSHHGHSSHGEHHSHGTEHTRHHHR